jgi:hypothetical protein
MLIVLFNHVCGFWRHRVKHRFSFGTAKSDMPEGHWGADKAIHVPETRLWRRKLWQRISPGTIVR